jgi:hypothetical protein
VQAPTKYDLIINIINLKTAKALGLTIAGNYSTATRRDSAPEAVSGTPSPSGFCFFLRLAMLASLGGASGQHSPPVVV